MNCCYYTYGKVDMLVPKLYHRKKNYMLTGFHVGMVFLTKGFGVKPKALAFNVFTLKTIEFISSLIVGRGEWLTDARPYLVFCINCQNSVCLRRYRV